MKFHGESRIRQPGSWTKDSNCPGITRATPLSLCYYTRHICIFHSRLSRNSPFALFTLPSISLSPSLSFIFTFIPNRQMYPCYSLSLNITTFFFYEQHPHWGIESTFSQKYASLFAHVMLPCLRTNMEIKINFIFWKLGIYNTQVQDF